MRDPRPGLVSGFRRRACSPREGLLQLIYGRIKGEIASFAGCAVLHFNFAVRQALWPNDHLPRQADQIHGLELGPGALACVVVKNVVALTAKRRVKLSAGRAASAASTKSDGWITT